MTTNVASPPQSADPTVNGASPPVHPMFEPAEVTNRRPPGQQAFIAYWRDLEGLLKTHYRQWVAYHGLKRIGIAKNRTELYQRCLSQGIDEREFVVFCIEPEGPDEIILDPPPSA